MEKGTYFGYIVSGSPTLTEPATTISANLRSLEKQLRLFWKQKEILDMKLFTPEERLCEEFF